MLKNKINGVEMHFAGTAIVYQVVENFPVLVKENYIQLLEKTSNITSQLFYIRKYNKTGLMFLIY